MMLAACEQNTPYHHFVHSTGAGTADDGWDKEDTLHFSVDTLRKSGQYTLSIETRVSDQYPYRNLSMMVEETIFRGPSLKYRTTRRYPVKFELRAEDGSFEGMGLGQHELTKVLTNQYLLRGDSIHIKVYHKMRRLVMPGITDIGIKVAR